MRCETISPAQREKNVIVHMVGWAGSGLSVLQEHRQVSSSAHTSEPRRNAPKVGRNDPCPCGSGKKYKKCCGGASVN
jgi:preprotein translocase subunit SecA